MKKILALTGLCACLTANAQWSYWSTNFASASCSNMITTSQWLVDEISVTSTNNVASVLPVRVNFYDNSGASNLYIATNYISWSGYTTNISNYYTLSDGWANTNMDTGFTFAYTSNATTAGVLSPLAAFNFAAAGTVTVGNLNTRTVKGLAVVGNDKASNLTVIVRYRPAKFFY